MKNADVLKLRIKNVPSTEFSMYHYYLCIMKFNIRYEDQFDEYLINCSYNKWNPLTYIYKFTVFMKALFEGAHKRYKLKIDRPICSTYCIFMKRLNNK